MSAKIIFITNTRIIPRPRPERFWTRAAAFGIEAARVDGQDVRAVNDDGNPAGGARAAG